jgi:hypothetical protein
MVFPSSGTLTLRRRANALVRCQNGTLSGKTAVSLNEVEERPTERAAILSEEGLFLDSPTGLLDDEDDEEDDGQSWYRDAAGWARFASEGLFASEAFGGLGSLEDWISLSERDRRGRW